LEAAPHRDDRPESGRGLGVAGNDDAVDRPSGNTNRWLAP
jgi:hypothetical protein